MEKSIARRMTELSSFFFFVPARIPRRNPKRGVVQRGMHQSSGEGEGYIYIYPYTYIYIYIYIYIVFRAAAKRDRIDEFLRARECGSDLRFNGPALRTRINRPLYGRLFFTVASVKMLSFFYDGAEKVPGCPQSISLALRRSGRTIARNNVQQCSSKLLRNTRNYAPFA